MLALVGSGEYLPGMEVVDRALLERLGGSPRVVCLPTAAGREGPERVAYWSDLGVSHFSKLGAQVESLPVLSRTDAQEGALARRVAGANLVYLSGGRPDYLLATLRDSLVWEAILDVLGRGGLLAGCSAGAMVQGEWIPGFPGWQRAFNLLPGAVVVPHYDEVPSWLGRGLRLWIGRRGRMLGIPGYTALLVDGDTCRVLGGGPVLLCGRNGRRSYAGGESMIWSESEF
jgi:cyanophycinase